VPTGKARGSQPAKVVSSRFEAAERVVALGDVHGDMAATRAALRLGGLVDDNDHWVGGDTVLVQTGDILDRGDDEQAIMDWFERLQDEALEAGGRVHVLSGNHELMNAAGDFRYVTPGGFRDFQDAPGANRATPARGRLPELQRARAAVFFPGGSYAKKMSDQPVAIIVGDTVFAHGGVLPKHVRYGLDKLNAEVGAWLLGTSRNGVNVVQQVDSPIWSREYSDNPDKADCDKLEQTLSLLEAKRMVVGHTVQPTIRPACSQRVWRVDVGMAAHYGGKPEVLEITKTGARPLK